MFSDRYRVLKIALLSLGIAALAFSARFWESAGPDYRRCLAEPESCDGQLIPFFIDARIIRIEPDRLVISQPEGEVVIRVPGGTASIGGKPGDYLEARAIFHREGWLELEAIQVAPLRRLKIAVSLLPVLAVAYLLFKTIGWKDKRLIIKVT